MKVHKVINNNIVSSFDSQEREIVVMGRGLGFGQKPGMEIDEEKIEKVFRMDTTDQTRQLQDLLYDVPLERVRVVDEIISKARERIADKMQRSIYITLIDHINFAIERQKENIAFANPLLNDVRHFFPVEYGLGREAVELINDRLDIHLPKDEAASIALHLINAQFGKVMPETIDITKIIQNSMKIVKYFYKVEFDEGSLNYQRFLTHMKFFAQRAVSGEMLSSFDGVLNKMIRIQYEKAYQCGEKIGEYVKREFQIEVPLEELTYLAVHIGRIAGDFAK